VEHDVERWVVPSLARRNCSCSALLREGQLVTILFDADETNGPVGGDRHDHRHGRIR
jgi:hypothetical protein